MPAHRRLLTPDEIDLVRTMFGTGIDCATVTVNRARWFPLQPRTVAMSPDGHLWLHPAGDLYADDYARAPLGLRGLFIHEMTHVWQHQRGVCLPLARHPFCRYHYRLTPGWPLARYGLEQQAEIVRHAWLLRQGGRVAGAPPLAQYETLLAFPGRPSPDEHRPPAR